MIFTSLFLQPGAFLRFICSAFRPLTSMPNSFKYLCNPNPNLMTLLICRGDARPSHHLELRKLTFYRNMQIIILALLDLVQNILFVAKRKATG